MKTYLFFALAFSLLIELPAYSFGGKPVQIPTPKPTDNCPAPGTVQAVDLSMPVDQPFLDAMKNLKVQTVIRYYDQPNETIRGKTLLPAEVALLARNGFDLMVVFQHNNNQIASFTTARGNSDAKRSLDLAAANGQRVGSAIYFGVDGGWSSASNLAAIKSYFTQTALLVRAAGFKVGAYGSGLVCSELQKSGLVDYCWLANATGWPGYSAFLATNAWSLVQKLPRDCGGKNVDFNVVSSNLRDLGQFRP